MSRLYLNELQPALASKQIHQRDPLVFPRQYPPPRVDLNDLGSYTYPQAVNKWGSNFADFPAENPNPFYFSQPKKEISSEAVIFNIFDGEDIKESSRKEWGTKYIHNKKFI